MDDISGNTNFKYKVVAFFVLQNYMTFFQNTFLIVTLMDGTLKIDDTVQCIPL